MPNPILYHNPRCSKSRQTLAMLNDKNVTFSVIEYLKVPLNEKDILALYQSLITNKAITKMHDMIRHKEPEYKLAGLSVSSSDEELVQALTTYPKLLERPIYKLNDLAAIGRPIENIEALLDD
jgi:arsenate reductase